MTQADNQKSPVAESAGFIDIHHHILHGVDDGPKSRGASDMMLASAYRDGTRHIVATSHFDPLGVCPDVGLLEAQLEELNRLCAEKYPGLTLSLGSEVFFGEGIRRRLRAGIIPTLAGSDHVLVEFLPAIKKDMLEQAVRHLANGGYVTILAHMERYPALVRDRDFAWYLKEKYGARMQVNANTLLTRQPFSVGRFLRHSLPEGLIDFVASDAHDTQKRKSNLSRAYGMLKERYGDDLAGRLFRDNVKSFFLMRNSEAL